MAPAFPRLFDPQSPLCREPALPSVLRRTGLPQEHGGSPGLAALPAQGCCPALAALGAGAGKALQSSDSPGIQPRRTWLHGFGPSCCPSALLMFCLPRPGLVPLWKRGGQPCLLQRLPYPQAGTAAGTSHPSQLLQGQRHQLCHLGCSLPPLDISPAAKM